jgi:hypothetical protein
MLSRIYGRQFCCFYDRSDYDVCSVVVWAEIPDVIENKKVYSQVTTDKEHKKLMKVLYPKTTNKTNNVKKLLLLLLALTMLSSCGSSRYLRKRTGDSLMPKV